MRLDLAMWCDSRRIKRKLYRKLIAGWMEGRYSAGVIVRKKLACGGPVRRVGVKQWRGRRRCIAAAVAVVGMSASARAATIRDDVPDSNYTSLASQSQYASSGYVDVSTGGGGFTFGSGTLIAPNWVITAAHVVTQSSAGNPPYPASQITFGQGSTSSFPAPNTVERVLVEPGWNGNLSLGVDLALVELTTPITSITPATLYSSSSGTEKGQVATVIGYGTTGTGLTGFGSTVGTARGYQNVIDAFGGDKVVGGTGTTNSLTNDSSNLMFSDFDQPGNASASVMGGTSALGLEGCSAPGDSGGGVFVTLSGATYLAGVTDLVGNFSPSSPTAKYGNYSGYTRTAVANSQSFIQIGGNWATDSNGSWNSAVNWPNGIPSTADSTANFGKAITAPRTVTLDGSYSVGTILFNNNNAYTVTAGSGGTITLDNGGLTPQVIDALGNHTISAAISLSTLTAFSVNNVANTLSLSGKIGGNGGINFSGPGSLLVSGSNTYAGGTTINSGLVTFAGPFSQPSGSSITNNGGLDFSSSSSSGAITGSGALTIAGTGSPRINTGSAPSSQTSLTINNGGLLDLTNNALTLHYGGGSSPNSTIQGYLASGYHAGGALWTGNTGITSTNAEADPAHHSLAFADGADGVVMNLPAGISTAIPGGGALPTGYELIAYVFAGDANLDGKVDFSDFVILSNHFGSNSTNWDQGNFNFDNGVDFSDFVILSNNFGDGVSGGNGSGAGPLQLAQYNQMAAGFGFSSGQIAGWDARIAELPEPTWLGLLGAGSIGLLQRRRGASGRRRGIHLKSFPVATGLCCTSSVAGGENAKDELAML
ncbi:MAG: trypsin-like serine protease [Planctomycetota bacterium]|nr:trypsin-like serine protease [Planctomycetota bacterium]